MPPPARHSTKSISTRSPPLIVVAHNYVKTTKLQLNFAEKVRIYWRSLLGSFLAYDWLGYALALIAVCMLDLVICWYQLNRVKYTNIDWTAYMEQVSAYKSGERNYYKIRGDTGPLVYPAGHLYVYSLLHSLTDNGQNVRLAQHIFAGIYYLNQLLVYALFARSQKIGGGVVIVMLALSYRIHSIYILRLFNDPIAMLLFYASANLLVRRQFALASILYSAAVSVKMNILLFAPALFFILLLSSGVRKTIAYLSFCALVQLAVSAEFLVHAPLAYFGRAFELGRVFQYRWSVNWQFVSESVFLASNFHLMLLIAHITLLLTLAFASWFRRSGGLVRCLRELLVSGRIAHLDTHEMLYALFTANLAGIVFARSIHYQFYAWYYHALFYLLFSSYDFDLHVPLFKRYKTKLLMWILMTFALAGIELVYVVYPPRPATSLLLFIEHVGIVAWLLYSALAKRGDGGIQAEKKEA